MSAKYKIRDQQGLNFLTCTVCGWIDLFSRAEFRDIILESWKYCREHKGLQIWGYVIMTNHIHLIANTKAPFKLEAVMSNFKSYTARLIIDRLLDESNPESRREWLLYLFSYFALGKKHKQTYQVWQHDSHPIELYGEHVVSHKLDYIHLNAVRSGFVDKPDDWKYSSAPFYAATKEHYIETYEPLLEITPIWQWFFEEGPGAW